MHDIKTIKGYRLICPTHASVIKVPEGVMPWKHPVCGCDLKNIKHHRTILLEEDIYKYDTLQDRSG